MHARGNIATGSLIKMKRICTFIILLLAVPHTALCQSKPSKKVQPSDKSNAQPLKVGPEHNAEPFDPSISKEFMPVAVKAYQALDHLHDHFWEDYDSDAAWTPRQMTAEKAQDDLNDVAHSEIEKSISFLVHGYLSAGTTNSRNALYVRQWSREGRDGSRQVAS